VSDNPKLTAVPACVGSLNTLRRLDLHSCNLEAVPPEVGALTALRQMSLHFNR
jgi:Leucine-rich repeat (LRR) protein